MVLTRKREEQLKALKIMKKSGQERMSSSIAALKEEMKARQDEMRSGQEATNFAIAAIDKGQEEMKAGQAITPWIVEGHTTQLHDNISRRRCTMHLHVPLNYLKTIGSGLEVQFPLNASVFDLS